jgi:hypothetical protein
MNAIGLGFCVAAIAAGVILQKEEVGGRAGSLLALVSSILGTAFLFGLLIGRGPRPRSEASPAAPQRRQDLRNYGVSFVACALGVVVGLLLRRAGWGNSFGSNFAVLSGLLGLFCGGAFLRALKG